MEKLTSCLQKGERILSETSLRHLPLSQMSFVSESSEFLTTSETEVLLSAIRKQYEEEAFCGVCKIIRGNRQHSSRADVALQFLSSNCMRRGPAEFFPYAAARRLVIGNSTQPLLLVLPAYSIKTYRRLKVLSTSPDLSEMFGIFRLLQTARSLEHILHRPCRIVLLTDGRRFCRALGHSELEVAQYQRALKLLIRSVHADQWIEVLDYEKIISGSLDERLLRERENRYQRSHDFFSHLARRIFDIKDLEATLKYMDAHDPEPPRSSGEGTFSQLFRSLQFSINCAAQTPQGKAGDEWERTVFCALSLPDVTELWPARELLLNQTLHAAIEYISRIRMDRMGEDPVSRVFPQALRCTIHPKLDQLGLITVNQRTRIEPWHGSGYLTMSGGAPLKCGVDFRIALESSGFYPVKLKTPWNPDSCLYMNEDLENVMHTASSSILCDCPSSAATH